MRKESHCDRRGAAPADEIQYDAASRAIATSHGRGQYGADQISGAIAQLERHRRVFLTIGEQGDV
jgi:hypothetical protein